MRPADIFFRGQAGLELADTVDVEHTLLHHLILRVQEPLLPLRM